MTSRKKNKNYFEKKDNVCFIKNLIKTIIIIVVTLNKRETY